MTSRRSFFAALIAPLIARWWPKPAPRPFPFHDPNIVAFIQARMDSALADMHKHLMYECEIGTGWIDGIYRPARLSANERNFDPRRLPE